MLSDSVLGHSAGPSRNDLLFVAKGLYFIFLDIPVGARTVLNRAVFDNRIENFTQKDHWLNNFKFNIKF